MIKEQCKSVIMPRTPQIKHFASTLLKADEEGSIETQFNAWIKSGSYEVLSIQHSVSATKMDELYSLVVLYLEH